MKILSKSSVSIIALSMMIDTAWGMNKDSDEEGTKSRYSVGKDWDERKSVASNAFSQQSNRTAKKEELSYDEQDEWERGTVRTDLDDVEVRGQKLTEITALKKHFFKGNLEITPQNYETLTKHTKIYATAFKMFDKGIVIKGWNSSLGFESLSELLYTFENLKIFKANIQWDKEEDVSETIARAIQFYENLTDLDIANCRLNDETMVDIMESVKDPKKLSLLDVRGNKLSKDTLLNLKKHFPNLASFKSDISLEAEKYTPPAIETLSLQEKKKTLEKAPPMVLSHPMKPKVEEEDKQLSIPNASLPPKVNISSQSSPSNNQAVKQSEDISNKPSTPNLQKKLEQADILEALKKVETKGITIDDFVELLNSASIPTTLSLYNNTISDVGAKGVAKTLETNSTLTNLTLYSDSLGEEGVKGIMKALERNRSLTYLYLHGNIYKNSAEGVKGIAKALETNKTLTSLVLMCTYIGVEGAKEIAKALETNKTLTNLNLAFNKIGVEGAKSIATALETNKTLTDLNLNSTSISDEGVKVIAKALESNRTITNLDMQYTGISAEGAKAIAKILETNKTLTNLALYSNAIGDVGTKAIAKSLQTNRTLTILNLGGNKIGDEGAKAIAKVLETNKTLTWLGLTSNSIGNEGGKAIAKALEINATLTTLLLDANNISDDGAQAIAKALRSNKTLTTLHLSKHNIGDEGKRALEIAQQQRKPLLYLVFF